MKIAIGNDHGAVDYKNTIMEMLRNEGHEVIDNRDFRIFAHIYFLELYLV